MMILSYMSTQADRDDRRCHHIGTVYRQGGQVDGCQSTEAELGRVCSHLDLDPDVTVSTSIIHASDKVQLPRVGNLR
jgi:hypothetical protein